MGKLDFGVLLRTLGGVVCLNNHLDNIGACDIRSNFVFLLEFLDFFALSRLHGWRGRRLTRLFDPSFLLGWYTVQQFCFSTLKEHI